VSGDPHGIRTTCSDGGGDVCKVAFCDGAKDRTTCAGFKNGTKTPCKPASCSGTTFIAESTCDGLGGCKAPPATSCVPYKCEATGCRSSCTTSDQCDDKFSCVGGTCVEGARCTDDKLGSIGKDGTTTSCAPYNCGADGLCKKACSTAADCIADYACNPDTKTCDRGTAGATGSSGCGCSVIGGGNQLDTVGGALAVLALVASRRRRRL
jgi:MYXO-CTERM domain-containing protein